MLTHGIISIIIGMNVDDMSRVGGKLSPHLSQLF